MIHPYQDVVTLLLTYTEVWTLVHSMNSSELIRLLKKHGVTFETHRSGSGHQTARRGDRKIVIPVHGSGKDLGKGLVLKILKDLGIEPEKKNPAIA